MNKLQKFSNQMNIHGEDVIDKWIVEKILMTLLAKYDLKIGIIEKAQELETLSAEELMGVFKASDERL